MIEEFANEICTELSAGYFSDLANIPFNFFGINDKIANLNEVLCTPLTDYGLNLVLGSYDRPITNDYKVGAPALATLNASVSSIPGVAFHGVEENTQEDLFYRNVYSLDNDPNAEDPFDADEDGVLLERSRIILMDFIARRDKHQRDYDRFKRNRRRCTLFGVGFGFIARATAVTACISFTTDKMNNAKRKQLAWQRGIDYFPNINTNWEVIIGARERKYECECRSVRCDYGDCDYGEWENDSDALQLGCPRTYRERPDSWIECRKGNSWVTILKPSDGVILQESAIGSGIANAERELTGSNHQQMRNDSNTKDALEELFDGAHGDFFITDTK